MNYKKVLVTGGAGFIGSNLCEKLLELEKQIIIFDNGFRMGFLDSEKNNNLCLIKGDITNQEDWKKIPTDVDFIFHLGAINGTKFFYEIPEKVLEINTLGTLNMLKWISQTTVKGFFFASSSEIYGFPKIFPTPETEEMIIPNPLNPRFSYSSSKMIGEIFCINFAKKLGVSYSIGRFHNVYGPRMGFEHVIPEFIKRMVKEEEFIVQGDGTESRCFCYVQDAVDAMILMSNSTDAHNKIFNIGTQDEISINQLVNLLKKISKKEVKVIHKPFENAGTKRRVPDITKLKSIGYEPKISLNEGLSKTFDWYQKWWSTH